jgi:hypothetical protein
MHENIHQESKPYISGPESPVRTQRISWLQQENNIERHRAVTHRWLAHLLLWKVPCSLFFGGLLVEVDVQRILGRRPTCQVLHEVARIQCLTQSAQLAINIWAITARALKLLSHEVE